MSTMMPALFLGHGSPMNAVEESTFSRQWEELGRLLPRPRAILCLSAHWETDDWLATAMAFPRTIHDFRGFPPELHACQYPAPGSPSLAARACQLVEGARPTESWGLDHGAWCLLRRLYPLADLPVVQWGLKRQASLAEFAELGRKLRPLRREGVLILGSGNIVHHLGRLDWEDAEGRRPAGWATEFDEWAAACMRDGDLEALTAAEGHPLWPLAAPSREHFLPLLGILGLREEGETLSFPCQGVVMGSLSMRAVLLHGDGAQ